MLRIGMQVTYVPGAGKRPSSSWNAPAPGTLGTIRSIATRGAVFSLIGIDWENGSSSRVPGEDLGSLVPTYLPEKEGPP